METAQKGFVPILVALLVALVLGTGTLSIAADSSLPGDPLYGIKQLKEKIKTGSATTPEAKAKVYEEIVKTKQAEVEKLQAKGADPAKIAQATSNLEQVQKKAEEATKQASSTQASATPAPSSISSTTTPKPSTTTGSAATSTPAPAITATPAPATAKSPQEVGLEAVNGTFVLKTRTVTTGIGDIHSLGATKYEWLSDPIPGNDAVKWMDKSGSISAGGTKAMSIYFPKDLADGTYSNAVGLKNPDNGKFTNVNVSITVYHGAAVTVSVSAHVSGNNPVYYYGQPYYGSVPVEKARVRIKDPLTGSVIQAETTGASGKLDFTLPAGKNFEIVALPPENSNDCGSKWSGSFSDGESKNIGLYIELPGFSPCEHS